MAGDAAARAALDEVAGELRRAETEGRLVRDLPLEAVSADYLVRDRIVPADDEGALKASLAARGQQVPVEVEVLDGGRYGLISGWRRLAALRELHAETGAARFATVRALVRPPRDRASAYLAMVEENEIRSGLSYYERGRIAWMAAERGVYPTPRSALQGLFANASRARRSKIGSFVTIARTLDPVLRFPTHIPERLGLKLARALDGDPDLASRIAGRLSARPPATPEAELAALTRALKPAPDETAPPERPEGGAGLPAVTLSRRGTQVRIAGRGVTDAFCADLEAWLEAWLAEHGGS